MARRPARFLLALLWLCLLAGPPAGAAPAPERAGGGAVSGALARKNVLLFSSYGFGRPGVDSFISHYGATLTAAGVSSENIIVSHLNLNRNPGTAYRQRMRELLTEQFRGEKIDLILTLQQPALDFALTELRELAPETPIIALDAVPPAGGVGQRRLLFTPPQPNVRGTLEQALHLFPATERIVATVGTGEGDQRIKQLVQGVVAEMGLRAQVEYTDGLTFDGITQRVSTLPPHTIVLSLSINRDISGAARGTFGMNTTVAKVANAPVFVLYSIGIGSHGTLGGSVLHVENTAEHTARNSIEVLLGTRAIAPGVTIVPLPSLTMYDWQQLQRWGGDARNLPADTVFVNRPPTIWEEHRNMVLAGAGAIALLSLATLFLGVQRRNLGIAEARFRVLVEFAPEAIMVYDVKRQRFVDANSKAEKLFGVTREKLLEGGPERFYEDLQPDGLDAAESIRLNSARALAGEEMIFERNVRAADGRSFPCEVSLVALPSRSGTLLRGGFSDISARKQHEQSLVDEQERLEAQVAERTAALQRAAHDAEAANRAKSRFLANMSHELRTPLNSIIGFSQIMCESTSMFDDEKHNVEIINRSGHHLLSLINDILELSKIEAGQVKLDIGSVHIGEIVRDIFDMMNVTARLKGVALLVDAPPLLPPVLTDGGKLRQVLINLLSNAVKFTDSGSVTLRLSIEEQDAATVQLKFAVSDTGIGIATDMTERIFDPFAQADTPRSRAGTGLGLTISREFVHLLGGTMALQSRLGEGSTFSFTLALPLAPEGQAQAPQPTETAPPTAPAEVAPLEWEALLVLDLDTRNALRAALQELDVRRVNGLLENVGAARRELADAIAAMLARHQYRELCALLERGFAGTEPA